MNSKSDPLVVLLDVKEKLNLEVSEDIIRQCYELQRDHQYDQGRDTMKRMQALIESEISKQEGNMLL